MNSAAGFSGTVALSCAGAPAEANCSLSSSTVSVSPGMPGQFTVSVATTAPTSTTAAAVHGPGRALPGIFEAIAIFMGAVGLLGVLLPLRKKYRAVMLANPTPYPTPTARAMRAIQASVLVFALAISFSACGGGSTASDPAASDPGTPLGTYTITVTATVTVSSTTVTRTVQLPLTIN